MEVRTPLQYLSKSDKRTTFEAYKIDLFANQ